MVTALPSSALGVERSVSCSATGTCTRAATLSARTPVDRISSYIHLRYTCARSRHAVRCHVKDWTYYFCKATVEQIRAMRVDLSRDEKFAALQGQAHLSREGGLPSLVGSQMCRISCIHIPRGLLPHCAQVPVGWLHDTVCTRQPTSSRLATDHKADGVRI